MGVKFTGNSTFNFYPNNCEGLIFGGGATEFWVLEILGLRLKFMSNYIGKLPDTVSSTLYERQTVQKSMFFPYL